MASHGWKHKIREARVPSGCQISARRVQGFLWTKPSFWSYSLLPLCLAQGNTLAPGFCRRTKVDHACLSQAQRLQTDLSLCLFPPRPHPGRQGATDNSFGKSELWRRTLTLILSSSLRLPCLAQSRTEKEKYPASVAKSYQSHQHFNIKVRSWYVLSWMPQIDHCSSKQCLANSLHHMNMLSKFLTSHSNSPLSILSETYCIGPSGPPGTPSNKSGRWLSCCMFSWLEAHQSFFFKLNHIPENSIVIPTVYKAFHDPASWLRPCTSVLWHVLQFGVLEALLYLVRGMTRHSLPIAVLDTSMHIAADGMSAWCPELVIC